MIRRAFLLVAAAAMCLLVPSVAMADYEAPGFSSSVTDSTPVVNQCIIMTVDGGAANAGEVLTLTATGPSTVTVTATTNKKGVAKFRVCLKVVGNYTLTVRNADGAVVAEQTIKVHAAGAAGGGGGSLSQTGSNVLPLAGGGALLVLLGVGAVVIARRRSPAAAHV